VIRVTFGTVAFGVGVQELGPVLDDARRTPGLVPGMKPGTSTRVRMGMLKASQKRTKRAALRDAALDVQQPGQHLRVVGDHPDASSRPCGRSRITMFLAHLAGDLEEVGHRRLILRISSLMS
jgi:hypothetical protein